jgi:hypothetical protein
MGRPSWRSWSQTWPGGGGGAARRSDQPGIGGGDPSVYGYVSGAPRGLLSRPQMAGKPFDICEGRYLISPVSSKFDSRLAR